MSGVPGRITEFLSGDKARKIIVAAGIALIALLFVSTLIPETKAEEQTAPAENAAQIERDLEQRLESLLSKIEGAGSVTVMVTLDRTSERVFAEETRTESSSDTQGDSVSRSGETETGVVLAGGGKEALEKSVIRPKVRGVAVICSGASDPVVKERVTGAVAGVLDIGVSRVCVTC